MAITSDNTASGDTLHIKNMVCDRCKVVVCDTLSRLGLHIVAIELGIVKIAETPDVKLVQTIAEALQKQGFELLSDSREQTVDRIKTLVIEFVRYSKDRPVTNLSSFLADRLHSDYSALSKLFSSETGITIEKYFISQRIELVKELISYGELSLTEIAARLNYSSVAYLSAQFKSVTGITPSSFKTCSNAQRRQIDKI